MLVGASKQRLLPLILALAIFMQMLDATILNTALPVMAACMRVSVLRMQLAVISYALTLALVMPLSGFLCDRFGTRTVFVGALGLFVAGSLMCAVSPNLGTLVASRVVQATGGAMITPVARLILLKAYAKEEMLEALNITIMPALVGTVLGPLLGGYLVEYAGWHWIFLINIPIGCLGIWTGLRFLPDFSETRSKFDMPGYGLFGVSAFMISMAVEFAGRSDTRAMALGALCVGALALGLYVRYAQGRTQAIFPLSLFLIRTYRLGISGNLLSRIGMGAVPLLLPLLLQVGFGYAPSVSGWMLTPLALAALAVKPLIMPLMRRFGYRKVLVGNTVFLGMLIMSLGLVSQNLPLWALLPQLIFIGAANSIQFTSMNTLTLADLPAEQTSSGNGLMAVNQQLAMSLGLAVGALLLKLLSAQQWLTHGRILPAFRASFVILGAVTLLSATIFMRLKPHDGDNLTHKAA